MPVGGSRHYGGPGLGEGVWKCPACGVDNTGPLPQGCTVCGAGRPGIRAEAAAAGDVADHWASTHQAVSIAEAYRAGYQDGIRAARAAAPPPPEPRFSTEGKIARTIVAALELFRDRILATNPEETVTGEWMTASEVTGLIAQLHAQEPAHA